MTQGMGSDEGIGNVPPNRPVDALIAVVENQRLFFDITYYHR